MSSEIKKMRPEPNVFGGIKGVPVGTTWPSRKECSDSAVHPGILGGIYGRADEGAFSVVLSGGYEDDVDNGDDFTYTGAGGRQNTTRDGKKLRTGPQTHDQSFDHPPNRALYRSWQTGKKVRVVRGYKLNSIHAPAEGYRYDGLYTVTNAWMEKGKAGFLMCRYTFQRCPGQDPLPRLSYYQSLANMKKSERARRRQAKRARSPSVIRAKDERRPPDRKPQASDLSSSPSPSTSEQPEAGQSSAVKAEASDYFDRPPRAFAPAASTADPLTVGPDPVWKTHKFSFAKKKPGSTTKDHVRPKLEPDN